MLIGMLIRLGGFSIRKPKTVAIIAATLVILAFGVHYKLLVGERDKLRVAEQGYKDAVTAFELREATFQEDLLRERVAASTAVAERDAARRDVTQFLNSRNDLESIAWANKQLPVGELERLCVALPEMVGCGE